MNNYYLREIPKVAHFVWANRGGLPLSRFLSIASFAILNPGFKVLFHTFETEWYGEIFSSGESFTSKGGYSYIEKLISIGVTIKRHDLSYIGVRPDLPPPIISDILRFMILYDEGGWYFDTDIIFIKPLTDSYLNSRLYSECELFYSSTKRFTRPFSAVRIGMLGAAARCPIIRDAIVKPNLEFALTGYQEFGADRIGRILGLGALRSSDEKYFEVEFHNFSDRLIYLFDYSMLLKIPKTPFNELGWGPYQIAVHWYGGARGSSVSSSIDLSTEIFPELILLAKTAPLIEMLFAYSYSLAKSHLHLA